MSWTEWVVAIEVFLALIALASFILPKWAATWPWKEIPRPVEFRGVEWGWIHIGQFRFSPRGKCKACSLEAEFGTEENPHPIPAYMHKCVGGAS